MASLKSFNCSQLKPIINKQMSRYTSHLAPSLKRESGCSDRRRVFSGDTLRIEISGSKAKRKEMINPNARPWPMAGQEIFVSIVTGRKSFSTSGKNCWMMVPMIAPMMEPIKPMPGVIYGGRV